jgi:glycosyltransferase involved in cell wall biosynthesis
MLFSMGNFFIVHSEMNRKQLTGRFQVKPDRVAMIPHGPLDFHVRRQIDRESIRKRLGFSPGNKVILLFGAVRSYKGVDTALKAFAEVIHEVPESRLLIAGKLWVDWRPYQELIDRLDIQHALTLHLKYIPSREVYRYFEVSDLAVLPYHHFDSQSGVGATAVSFRTPLIVTDVGGLPDLVMDKRFVVPSQDHSTLARVIIECLSDPVILEEMSEGSMEVANKISWSGIAQKTWAIYLQILNKSANREQKP